MNLPIFLYRLKTSRHYTLQGPYAGATRNMWDKVPLMKDLLSVAPVGTLLSSQACMVQPLQLTVLTASFCFIIKPVSEVRLKLVDDYMLN